MKNLRKSSDKKICGVCGGIGEYFNIDPTLIRLIFLILLFISFGTVAIIYIVASFIIPEPDLNDIRKSESDVDHLKSANVDESANSSRKSSTSSKDMHSDSDFDKFFKK